MFDTKLKLGQVVDNKELMHIFKCGNMGGMRKSNKTNALVIISDYTKGLYNDKWTGSILHYTGIEVFLFEVFEPKKYVFGGRVELAGEPYQEKQKDDEDNMRNVWIFPLKRIE